MVEVAWRSMIGHEILPTPCTVTFRRIGPQKLDDDNLARSFKWVQDQVARRLHVDDGDGSVVWQYTQEVIGKRVYGLVITISYPERNPSDGSDN